MRSRRFADEQDELIAVAEEIARVDSSLTHFDAQVAAAFLLFRDARRILF
ncbi:MAG: hypothetical protein IPG56_14835 [Caulobacteraceae bacterium]|nr:hypothetical protein [Caulobacteraceae bacterium]